MYNLINYFGNPTVVFYSPLPRILRDVMFEDFLEKCVMFVNRPRDQKPVQLAPADSNIPAPRFSPSTPLLRITVYLCIA